MKKIREMVDVNTIVGDPIQTPDGVTLIPISKVTFGFTSGGSEFVTKSNSSGKPAFGGGSGAGVSITPIAFLVVRGENARILSVNQPAASSIDRIIEAAPDLIEKVINLIKKNTKGGEEHIIEEE